MTEKRLRLDPHHRDQLLQQVFQLCLILLAIGLLTAVFLFSTRTVLALLIGFAIITLGEWLRRRGKLKLARSLLLGVMLVLIGVLAILGEGNDDSVILFMAPIMVLAGLVTDRREFWIYAGFAGLMFLLLAAGEYNGSITHSGFLRLPLRQQVGETLVILLAHAANCALIDMVLNRIGSFVVSVRDELEQESLNWHQAAMTDPLTGLLNRRGFLDHADWQLRRAALDRNPIALMVIDIDHFKQINDRHGHDIGDIVLQEMARRLKNHLRSSDASARLGGEEFCALLTGIHREGAIAVADRFRQTLAEVPVQTAQGPVAITVSIGLSISLEGRMGVKDLLQDADQALYQAKRSGRNRVIVAGDEPYLEQAAKQQSR